jgi:hypothetical protein
VLRIPGSETFSWIRSGTKINVSDPDSNPVSNPDPKLDQKKIFKKKPYFKAEIRKFRTIIHISHLQVVVRRIVDP